jgi:hypothetical protein
MNNDILESDEFIFLVSGCEIHQRQMIKDYIRQHFTPKIVEKPRDWCVITDKNKEPRMVPIEYVGSVDDVIFSGTREECLTERKRLESLTKGREESKIICMGEAFGRARCTVDCQNCIDTDKEHEVGEEKGEFYCAMYATNSAFGKCDSQCSECRVTEEARAKLAATPNRDNYRAELLTVATAAMQAITTGLYSQDEATSIIQNHKYAKRFGEDMLLCDIVAFEAVETAKSLITAIDKEVKSNPASE